MKISFLMSAVAALFLAGCGDNSSTSSSSSTSAPNNGSANYLGAVAQAQQSSEKKIDTAYLTQDIQQFDAAEGRFPTNLQELVPTYIAKLPDVPFGYKLDYDSTSGTVKVVKQ